MNHPQALTLEQMRADVAAALAEDPEEIRDDDNLMDLGLDSMRVLSLVMQWSETGIALDVSQLAEHVTLGQWWQTIQRLQRHTADEG